LLDPHSIAGCALRQPAAKRRSRDMAPIIGRAPPAHKTSFLREEPQRKAKYGKSQTPRIRGLHQPRNNDESRVGTAALQRRDGLEGRIDDGVSKKKRAPDVQIYPPAPSYSGGVLALSPPAVLLTCIMRASTTPARHFGPPHRDDSYPALRVPALVAAYLAWCAAACRYASAIRVMVSSSNTGGMAIRLLRPIRSSTPGRVPFAYEY
jgi:hypothetical protein